MDTRCPCGAGEYAECCGPLHDNRQQAETAEQVMRARYSAFAKGHGNYIFRSWHPRTRPPGVDARPTEWIGLEILEVVGGGPEDTEGVVEFVAVHPGGVMHERSRFVRRARRWVYLDAESC